MRRRRSDIKEEPAEQIEKLLSDIEAWQPRTELGRKVKSGEITDIDFILDSGLKILEPEIVDKLLPGMESELLLIGQSKEKFGGGQRRVFKQTQKKTAEGNRPQFATVVVIGNKNGYVGLGNGKSRETVPAREKAIKNAKKNLFKIRRGTGSWEDSSTEPHSLPFAVNGRCGSVRLMLMPAPRGSGLVAHKEVQKILRLAGVSNAFSKTFGHVGTTTNLIKACEAALRQLMRVKVSSSLNVAEGAKRTLRQEFQDVMP